jgi:predicted nucleic acid-binding Zn ribbon protein
VPTGRSLCPKQSDGQAIFTSTTLASAARGPYNPGREKTMPTYIYQTLPKKKGQKSKRFEVVQKMKDKPLTKHPKTGEPVERVITGGCGVVFHGASIMSMNVPKGTR